MIIEQRREYDCNLVFNRQKITKLTITDHYETKHKISITDLLIRKLLEVRLNAVELDSIE